MMEISQLEARGYTKTLFTQLHVQNLSDDLEWWLKQTNHSPYTTHLPSIQQIPMQGIYEKLAIREYDSTKCRKLIDNISHFDSSKKSCEKIYRN